jgi:Calponin homology (CH) domain
MSKKGKDALLLWCQRNTDGFQGVNVRNFHTSWRDGRAFCAIVAKFRPDKLDFASQVGGFHALCPRFCSDDLCFR